MKDVASFGLPFFLRVVIPGAVGFIILYPLFYNRIPNFQLETFVFGLIFVGLFIYFINSFIYRFYEGYYFPAKLSNWLATPLTQKVKRLYNETTKIKEVDREKYDRIWFYLRAFPLNDNGEPEVTSPTYLGNQIASYENYSWSRYRMDSAFYFYRIWLVMDENSQKRIDYASALANCSVYISFITLIASIAYYIKIILIPILQINLERNYEIFLLLGFLLTATGSYVFYRIAIWQHQKYGEYFKALFDIFRSKIPNLEEIPPKREIKQWEKIWAYLQYLYIKCEKCGEYYPIAKNKCQKCEENKGQSG